MSIERIAVLGAGIMGRGIAYAATVSGFETRLHDALPGTLDKGRSEIMGLMVKGVAAGKLQAEVQDHARLRVEADLAKAVDGADLVIEAAPENIQLKCQLFGQLDRLTGPARWTAV